MDKLKNKFKKKSGDEEEYDEEFEEEYEDDEIVGDILDEEEQLGDLHASDDITGDIDISGLDNATLSDIPSEDLDENTDIDINAEATDTLEADLLSEDLDVTGDIDLSQLQEDIEVEEPEEDWDEDEDEDEDDEESSSPIQKIVGQIKDALGKLGKKKNNDDDDDEEDIETRTEVDPDAITNSKLKKKGNFVAVIGEKVPALKGLLDKINKKKSSDDDDDEDDPNAHTPITYDDGDEDEKPKKKIKIIHILIVVAALGLFYEDIFPPEPTAPAPKLKARKKPKRKKPQPKKEVVKKPTLEKPVAPINDRTAEQIKEVGTAKKEDIVSDTDIPVREIEKKPVEVIEDPVISDTEDTSDDMEDLFDENDSSTQLETPKKVVVPTPSNDSVSELDAFEDSDENDSMPIEGTGQSEPGLELVDGQIDDQIIDGTVNQDITKSILEDLEVKIQVDKKQEKIQGEIKPMDPPTYEINGRSLVYNCNGKHWACIDSVSFKTCEKNYAWNSSQGRAIECYPVKGLPSAESCEAVQQKYIDNIEETEFCSF